MKPYTGSILLLFAVIRSTNTQVCSLSNDCGVIGGKTRLFCNVTAPFDRRKLNRSGPARELIAGGSVLNTSIVDIEEASDGFYLTILNTTKDDIGTYICEYRCVPHDCIVTQDDFQVVTFVTIFFLAIVVLVYIFLKHRAKDTENSAKGTDFEDGNGAKANDRYGFTMKRYFGSFLILFAVIRSTSTQVCNLSNDCGVIGGKTKLFCKVTAPFDRTNLNWSGPGRDLISGGSVLDTSSIDLEEASDGFYLTILNTNKDDKGTYRCEYSFVQHDCIVTQDNFQALMCKQKVDGHNMIITITYILQIKLPKISLVKSTGEAINGTFDPVIVNGFLKEIVWRSNDLSVGTYNYTVTGDCGLSTSCSGTVDTAGTTVAPSEMKGWEILLIVTTCFLVIAAIVAVVYRFCFRNRAINTRLVKNITSAFRKKHTVATGNPDLETVDEIQTKTKKEKRRSELKEKENKTEAPTDGEERHENKMTGVKYCFSLPEAVSGQNVTVTAVQDTASEKLVNSTDLSPKPDKLPPLEHTVATGNPDLETVDEIQTKTKKEKKSKSTEKRKKLKRKA